MQSPSLLPNSGPLAHTAVQGELLIGGTEKRWPGQVSDIRNGKGGIPHLVQGIRLVRVLLPAPLGGRTVILFLLQLPLMFLRVL